MIKVNTKKYKTFSFGEIASNISERVEPHDTDLDIYVGLEHLDPECNHIKRRGVPADVKGTKLRVYPGDIIFGKRRAYQRKAGLVDFDGICSAHAMVVRANPEVILPELFPFFMHSDVFMHRSVDVSEGSLSPTIKWKILAEEEFKLPPLTEQKRLADLLWSVDEVVENYIKIIGELSLLFSVYLKNLSGIEGDRAKINDIAHLHYGDGLKESDRREGPYPVVGSSGIVGKHCEYRVTGPGIIIGRKGSAGEVVWIDDDFWPIDTTYWVELKDKKVIMEFLFYLFKSLNLPVFIITTAIPGLNRDDVLAKKIKIPELSIQKNVVRRFKSIQSTMDKLNNQILKTKNIQKQIINQIFG